MNDKSKIERPILFSGDSSRIMSMKELEHYNVCALECARLADVDGKPHTIGMWTVSQHGNKEDER